MAMNTESDLHLNVFMSETFEDSFRWHRAEVLCHNLAKLKSGGPTWDSPESGDEEGVHH